MMNQVDSSSFDDVEDDDKTPKEWFQDWVNKFKIKINFKFHRRNQEDLRIKRSLISRFKRRNQEDFTREVLKRFFKNQT